MATDFAALVGTTGDEADELPSERVATATSWHHGAARGRGAATFLQRPHFGCVSDS